MNKKLQLLLVCFSLLGFQTIFAQQIKNEPQKPYKISTPDKVERVASLASRLATMKRPDVTKVFEVKDGRSSRQDLVLGKGSQGDDFLAKRPNALKNAIPTRTPLQVFETGASGSQPTDPAGAVGPNHYISVINSAYQVFDKNGNSLTGGLISASGFFTFASGGCCDLTASYDNDADRWVMSYLSSAGEGTQVAVSDGPDPVNDGWTIYTWGSVSDYQKLSVWRDGYYMTENTGSGNKLHVFERSAMIDAASAGTTPQILSFSMPGLQTGGFHSLQVLNISNNNWPTTGGATVVYMQDDAWTGVSNDHLKIWTATMDWATPGNSVISAASELSVTPFIGVFDGGNFSNLPQPNGGATIDALQATIMNQAQYRKFPGYNSAVFNFVVDVDGGTAKQAGIRWYELRQTDDGQPWTIHQEGTYAAPDNRHAWNASLIMDVQGNIGMGYTGMSSSNSTDSNVRVGSYYTGRFANDPLNTMTIAEGTIMAGDGNIPSFRYGDYSKIDIDPSDDKKFWFVTELMNNGRKNVAGVFQIAPNLSKDLSVISIDAPVSGSLSNAESITIKITNLGEDDATGFDVSYQIDGGAIVTETYAGTIASNITADYTFTTTADLSTEGQVYSIKASSLLTGDEDATNDSFTKEVTHIAAKDLGVSAITAPDTAETLSNEAITVTIKNYGAVDQSNFDVSYTINGGTPVVETVAGTVPAAGELSYTFTTLGNFSNDGAYSIVANTMLVDDANGGNDSTQKSIVNLVLTCDTNSNTTTMTIGPNAGTLTESVITITEDVFVYDVNVTLNIQHGFNSDLDVKLIGPDGTTEVILFEDIGGITDDFTNTVFDSDATNSIVTGTAPYTGVFRPFGNLADFRGLQSLGDWTLSITDDTNGGGGNLLDWSIEICTDNLLSVPENNLDGDFKLLTKGNNQYEINLTSATLQNDLDLKIYNMRGQTLLWRTLKNESGKYVHKLDMSYAAAGVYIIRLGNDKAGITKRIVVE
ncbi:MAG: proprotein convertase P-domain-containing protein [Flavobacteriaceae bacterium]